MRRLRLEDLTFRAWGLGLGAQGVSQGQGPASELGFRV